MPRECRWGHDIVCHFESSHWTTPVAWDDAQSPGKRQGCSKGMTGLWSGQVGLHPVTGLQSHRKKPPSSMSAKTWTSPRAGFSGCSPPATRHGHVFLHRCGPKPKPRPADRLGTFPGLAPELITAIAGRLKGPGARRSVTRCVCFFVSVVTCVV